jgi:integrase
MEDQGMANINRLRERQVRNAKPKRDRKAIMLPDGANLYLQATLAKDGSINRSWVFRYQLDAERHDLGLGPLHTVGLAEAREQARQLRLQLLAGSDPLQARREVERARLKAKAERLKAVTFKECAEQYLRVHARHWKSAKHAKQWGTTLETYVYPQIGNLAVADIEVEHVRRVLVPAWERIPESARRLRGRIETVLTYATAGQLRSGPNPASWDILQHLLGGKRQTTHHPALPFAEVPAFFLLLREKNSITSRALQFTILTATRTGEALGATWEEIDLQAAVWAIPAARMKGGKEHRVPLSESAMALLKLLPRREGCPYVFTADHRKPLNSKALREQLYLIRPGITTHGFRSTFSDWAHERTAHANHTIELALAHSVGNAVEKAYRRGDLFEKRRQLMAAWDRFLTTPLPASATVTPLRKVAADA